LASWRPSPWSHAVPVRSLTSGRATTLLSPVAEEKVMKPDPEIYLRTLNRLDCKAAESIFVDDFAENITAARSLGMNAIHFNPSVDLSAELRKLGIELL
jgi:beta-phosphoglucomutase-like phosphatase (HAD superfamily)